MTKMSKKEFELQASFRYMLRRFLRTSENNSRSAGITPQHYQLMLTIKGMKERDWATISEISESLQINHHTAVGLCNRAEQNNLIKRFPHDTDGRITCLRLTPKGDQIVTEIASQNRVELSNVLQEIVKLLISISSISFILSTELFVFGYTFY